MHTFSHRFILFQDDFAVEIESSNFYNNDRAIEVKIIGGGGGSFFIFREFTLRKVKLISFKKIT